MLDYRAEDFLPTPGSQSGSLSQYRDEKSRRGYPYTCVSYDPLKAMGESVEKRLNERFKYDEGYKHVEGYEVKDGRLDDIKLHEGDPTSTGSSIILLIQWLARPDGEYIHLRKSLMLEILSKYEVNPLFTWVLTHSLTGGSVFSTTHHKGKLHSFHICLRWPSLLTDAQFALYFQYNVITKQVRMLVFDGVQSRVHVDAGASLVEVINNSRDNQKVHPVAYLTPYLKMIGRETNDMAHHCRREAQKIETATGTSTMQHKTSSETRLLDLPPAQCRREIEALTSQAFRCGSDIAQTQKHLNVHLRSVEEIMRGFQEYPELRNWEDDKLAAERVEDLLKMQVDCCRGRQMEIDHLKSRVELQRNMLFSLVTQVDSRLNVRIAEETKSIAEETKKDSTSMKTIAAMTMVFLPGTFVCAILGMNFFQGDGATFVVGDKWWIFVAAAVPLTLLVFGVWYCWIRVLRKKERLKKQLESGSTHDLEGGHHENHWSGSRVSNSSVYNPPKPDSNRPEFADCGALGAEDSGCGGCGGCGG